MTLMGFLNFLLSQVVIEHAFWCQHLGGRDRQQAGLSEFQDSLGFHRETLSQKANKEKIIIIIIIF